MNPRLAMRTQVLHSLGAASAEAEELLAYNHNHFDLTAAESLEFPPPDDPFVDAWQEYEEAVGREGFSVLGRYLPQLRFPVQDGVSQTPEYKAATKQGADPGAMALATGLQLRAPERCSIVMHSTAAGRIPLILCGEREDFVALVRALTKRNEAAPIPDSMGACMVAGYANWHRIHRLREQYERRGGTAWPEEFQRILSQKELYQDQFILLSLGPYSGVSAAEMGLEEQEWLNRSLVLRREHECAHYFTRRVFRSMRTNLLDEVIADYFGITAAAGGFKRDWLLRFLGLESFPRYRSGGRLENYRGSLSDGGFLLLQRLVERAATNLEAFDGACISGPRGLPLVLALFLTLGSLTLEEMASVQGPELLEEAFTRARSTLASGVQGRRGEGNRIPELITVS